MSITFAIPFLGNYGKMATAAANAVKHYHPEARILGLTTSPADEVVQRVVCDAPFDALIDYQSRGLDSAGYSDVIWAKYEVIGLSTDDVIVVIDADMLMYSRIDHLVEAFDRSSYSFASVLDINPTLGPAFRDSAPGRDAFENAPALSACLLMFRSNPDLRDRLFQLAEQYDGFVHWPEQAILSLYAYRNGGFLDFGQSAVIQCRDEAVLELPTQAPFIHVGSPRPEEFGASPLRWDEKTYQEECAEFQVSFGAPFPEDRLVRDFVDRLHGRLGCLDVR